jgi:uncharacterized protein YuzE
MTRSRPLSFALYLAGATLVVGSVEGLLLLGRYGLPLLAFGLMAVSFEIAARHLRQTPAQETAISSFDINPYLALVPALKKSPQHSLWSHYDPKADTLAIHFTEPDTPNVASDSDMTDDDIIVHYDDAGEVIGLTILHASSRRTPRAPDRFTAAVAASPIACGVLGSPAPPARRPAGRPAPR